MGFSDLLTSSRGPGVIGTLLALLVLVGFGTLYIFVFDEGLQGGGKKIEAVIRDDGLALESTKIQVANLKETIKKGEALKDQAKEIEQLKVRNEAGAKSIEERTAERDGAIADRDGATNAWEAYKDEYRASEWASAEGEKYAELKTLDGKTYTDVVVKGVTHLGMRIMISSGPTMIDSDLLPAELKDRFQFSAEKKEAVQAAAAVVEEEHSDNVDIARLAKKATDRIESIREHREKIEKATAAIQQAKLNDPQYRAAIDRMSIAIQSEKSKKGGISKAPEMQVQLRAMQDRQKENRASISRNEQEVQASKRAISGFEREVEGFKDEIAKLKKEVMEKKKASAGPEGANANQ